MIQITREHEICMGHRVYGHEGKCKNLHGHNYRFLMTFRPRSCLDDIGRVIDFSSIKTTLISWLEENWDHKLMIYKEDPLSSNLLYSNQYVEEPVYFFSVPFNPTVENIALHFLNEIAPFVLAKESFYLFSITIFETSKCSATATISEEEAKKFESEKIKVLMPFCYWCKLQEGNEYNCKCNGKSDLEKIACPHAYQDLPF